MGNVRRKLYVTVLCLCGFVQRIVMDLGGKCTRIITTNDDGDDWLLQEMIVERKQVHFEVIFLRAFVKDSRRRRAYFLLIKE